MEPEAARDNGHRGKPALRKMHIDRSAATGNENGGRIAPAVGLSYLHAIATRLLR